MIIYRSQYIRTFCEVCLYFCQDNFFLKVENFILEVHTLAVRSKLHFQNVKIIIAQVFFLKIKKFGEGLK